jgi:methylmalonyl-CoA mutase, N-terminal domain
MVKAIEIGFPQKEIAEASYQYQRAVEAREKVIVGSNEFTIDEKQMETLYIDETVGERQSAKLKALRSRRDNAEVTRRLDALKRAAAQEPVVPKDGKISQANTMPYIIDCVRAYATVGEICQALKEVYGTYEEVSIT